MALDFPNSPTDGQVFSSGSATWVYSTANAVWTQQNLNAPYTQSINTQTANYVLVLTDAGKLIEMNVASANTLTIPLNSSVAFPIGTSINIFQIGAGTTTITPTGGVTLVGTPGFRTRAQYSSASIYKRATDTWVAFGDVMV